MYLASRKPFTRSAGMLYGSRECALSCARLFRCEQVLHFNELLCCAFANIYILLSAICRVRIGIGCQVAQLGSWRTIYNYRGKSLCVRLRGWSSFCTQMSAHTPTNHTLKIDHRINLGGNVCRVQQRVQHAC